MVQSEEGCDGAGGCQSSEEGPLPALGRWGLGGWGNRGIRRLLIIMKRKPLSELGDILAYVAEVVW